MGGVCLLRRERGGEGKEKGKTWCNKNKAFDMNSMAFGWICRDFSLSVSMLCYSIDFNSIHFLSICFVLICTCDESIFE